MKRSPISRIHIIQKRTIRKRGGLPIETIPNELLSDIVARVAGASLKDMTNAKLSCRMLKEISEDKYIYQNVCLDKFPVVEWEPVNEYKKAFLARCEECGNPELLYRQAVVDYFGGKSIVSAIRKLDKSVKSGHLGAFYATCIILIFSGDDELRNKGIKLLGGMKKSEFWRSKLRKCRNNLISILKLIWVQDSRLRRRPMCCCSKGDGHRKRSGWWSDLDEEGESLDCEACSVDCDISFVCEAIRAL